MIRDSLRCRSLATRECKVSAMVLDIGFVLGLCSLTPLDSLSTPLAELAPIAYDEARMS